ncbi:MAG: putative metal-dependent hydrolase [Thioalkalivibrio sp.]|nr:putative metal-dependent hydrolase [Thioalkalivibrio sp.]
MTHTKGDLEGLRYPVGRYEPAPALSAAERAGLVEEIAGVPAAVRAAVAGLSPGGLDSPYRAGGWTGRQVVHHLPDSHMNAYMRFKLALTEDEPTIKPYDEAAWAALPDGRSEDVESSLVLLESLHRRWTELMRSFGDAEWSRTYNHPERGAVTLEENLQLYAWHGRHHLGHIRLIG